MKRFLLTQICCVVLVSSPTANAQEVPEFPKPVKEHEWLKQFVGEWDAESEAKMAPDQPAMHCKGTMSAKMLGDFWMVSRVENNAGETTVRAIQTIGYDTTKQKYVGTWVDSLLNHMWHYEGTVDESGKILTLDADGPNFMGGGELTKYRDAYEFKSKDHILVTSSAMNDEGEWVTYMTGHYRRVK